jgi:signal transduction histidine kinase
LATPLALPLSAAQPTGYAEARGRLIVARLRRSSALAVPLIIAAAAIDRFAVAGPSTAYHISFAVQLAVCLGVMRAAGRAWAPRHAVALAVAFVASLYATLPFVLPIVPGDLGIFAGAIIGAMVAPALLFPWGAGAQGVVSGLLAVAYGLTVPWTDLHVGDRVHVGLALFLGACLSTTAAFILDRQQRANAALVSGLAGAARVSAALARIGQELISSLRLPELLERLGQATIEVLGCDTTYTLLWRPEEESFVVVASHGEAPETLEALRVLRFTPARLGGLVEALAAQGVVQVEVAKLAEATLADKLGNTAMLHIALKRGDAVVGIHMAGIRRRIERFSAEQERIALGIARIASMALENARLTGELEQANDLSSEFVSTMSHELRTPLNIIIGYGSLLLEEHFGPLSVDQRDALKRIARSSGVLLGLVDSTLDLGRLEAGRVTVEHKEVSLGDLFGELYEETRDLVAPRVRLAFGLAPDLPPVESDPTKLKAVLKNLVSNALKFTAEGSVVVEARRSGENEVSIAVSDTGVGIAPDALPIIFEPFRQAGIDSSRTYGGVGLGLYIVQRLLQLLGGSVSVESELGKGSVFVVRLPVRQPHPASEVESEPHPSSEVPGTAGRA